MVLKYMFFFIIPKRIQWILHTICMYIGHGEEELIQGLILYSAPLTV